jgi:hypothetical protein
VHVRDRDRDRDLAMIVQGALDDRQHAPYRRRSATPILDRSTIFRRAIYRPVRAVNICGALAQISPHRRR